MAPTERETRDIVAPLELRAAKEGSKSPGTIVGYAAVFNKYSVDMGDWREKISPGAFADCIKSDDVRGLMNHDENYLLGRTRSGTMRLVEDEVGLRMEIDLPDTSVGRDTAENIRVGNMSGCSFSFTTDVAEWDFSGPTAVRTLKKCRQLFDAGPVTFPAYEDTSVAVRSFSAERESRSAPPVPEPEPAPAPAPDHSVPHSLAKARLKLAEAF